MCLRGEMLKILEKQKPHDCRVQGAGALARSGARSTIFFGGAKPPSKTEKMLFMRDHLLGWERKSG
jgi:hypothetical protein